MKNEVLGVDIGGVIMSYTDVDANGLPAPLPEVFQSLRRLGRGKIQE